MNARRIFLASTAAGMAAGLIVWRVTRHPDRVALVAPLAVAMVAAVALFVVRLVRAARRSRQPAVRGPEGPLVGGPTPAPAQRPRTAQVLPPTPAEALPSAPARVRRPHWVWRALVATIGWVALVVAFPALIVAAAAPPSWLPYLLALAAWCVVLAVLADMIAWWVLPRLTVDTAVEMAADIAAEAHPLAVLPAVAGYELWRQSRTGGTETTRPEVWP